MKYLFFFISFLFLYASLYAQEEKGVNNLYSLELIPVNMESGRQYLILKTAEHKIIDTLIEIPSSYQNIVDYYIASMDTISYLISRTDGFFTFKKQVKSRTGIWASSMGCTWFDASSNWPFISKEDIENPPTYHLRGPDTLIRRSQGKEQIIDVEAFAKRLQVITSPKK